ncbi:MAG: hypothetical protein RBJ76_12850 [Stenomitos frigidus ULC029]
MEKRSPASTANRIKTATTIRPIPFAPALLLDACATDDRPGDRLPNV